MSDGPWRHTILDVADVRGQHWEDTPDRVLRAIQDPLVQDAALFRGRAFEEFLDERGVLLPDDEQLLAQQWLLAARSVFEVEAVHPGTGFAARDLRTGDHLDVRERTASRTLTPGAVICARFVPAGDTVQCFGGMEPIALHERDPDRLRAALGL